MKKYLLTLVMGLCFIPQVAYSQETEGMTFDDYMKAAEEDITFKERTTERIKLLDINSDNKISYNEITNAAVGIENIPDNISNAKQKEEMKGYWLQAFEENDSNNDTELTEQEIDSFVEKVRLFSLKQAFQMMDRNQDGVYDINDMPSMEESQKQLEESLENMQQALEKLEKTDSKELANQWMINIGAAVADEDYYQMDKNQDGCVTRDEYVAYELSLEEASEDKDLKMTSFDYARWYIDIKKEKPDCLTKEEYIADMSRPIDAKMEDAKNPENEKEYAKILFEEMDKDHNGKLTVEEYAEYNFGRDSELSAPDEPVITKENYEKMFLSIKAPDKGWMDENEFVEDYIKDE